MRPLKGKDRLIVALDLPSVTEALALIDRLDNVSFFKVGWQLFMTGVMGGDLRTLMQRLVHKNVFVDLKIPGDIDNTVGAVVGLCVDFRNVKFLTISESMPARSIAAAKAARSAKHSEDPKFLIVPLLSSLDQSDLRSIAGDALTVEQYIVARATAALKAGCDGVIASGQAIGLCREQLPPDTVIVSPGIRPAGSATDDHRRHTTPAEAIRMGADYLVVGRPIVKDADPHQAADRVMSEMDEAVEAARASAPACR